MQVTNKQTTQQVGETEAGRPHRPSLLWIVAIAGVPLLVAVAALSILAFK